MKKLKNFLGRWGLHAFLLPVFFIVHNYKQYYGLVSTTTAVKSLFEVLLYFAIIFLLLLAITKHINKSLQLTTLLGFLLFFFGVIKDFIKLTLHVHFLAKYTTLLPLLLITIALLAKVILQKKDFNKANRFQTLLLLSFILIDSLGLFTLNSTAYKTKNLLVKKQPYKIRPISDTINKPDVYYLVFDCYPGSTYLHEYMQFDNTDFDTILKEKGFHVLRNPISNYNRTAFSIAATLNYHYLQGIKNNNKVTSKEYNEALLTIKEAEVEYIFKLNNYKFCNLSIFDINDNPPIYKENFLSVPEKNILMYNSLIERVKKDVLWNFSFGSDSNAFESKTIEKVDENVIANQIKKREYNNKVIDSLLKTPYIKSSSPKFVYAHFFLPHPPYFYDETGKSNDLNYILNSKSFRDKNLFISYLKYTNSIILKICNNIISGSGNKAVIILESDHGFTDFEGGPDEPALFFKNYTAYYFPDKNYSSLYDSLSNINTFPIIFNKYFKTNIPLQIDSSIFLPD